MGRFEEACAGEMGQTTGIVAVGLVGRQRLQRLIRLPALELQPDCPTNRVCRPHRGSPSTFSENPLAGGKHLLPRSDGDAGSRQDPDFSAGRTRLGRGELGTPPAFDLNAPPKNSTDAKRGHDMAKKRNPEHLLRVSAYSHDPKDLVESRRPAGRRPILPKQRERRCHAMRKSYSLSALCCIIMKVSNVYSET